MTRRLLVLEVSMKGEHRKFAVLTVVPLVENQVTPFNIKTPDGETLYAWHILPRALYAKHETELLKQKLDTINVFQDTLAYRLLKGEPEATLIINCKEV
jgi:hypothetical protein